MRGIMKHHYHLRLILNILDQLELANKKQQISLINDFLKDGYDMIALYSKCFDFIIDQKVKDEE